MDENLIQKLIDLVQTTAPKLWEIAVRQVYAQNIIDTIVSVLFLIFLLFSLYFCLHVKEEYPDEEKKGYLYLDSELIFWIWVWGILLDIISTTIIIYNICAVASRLYNPNYYAIEILMNLVK